MLHSRHQRRLLRICVLLVLFTGMGIGSAAVAAATVPHKKKPLSLTNISWVDSATANTSPVLITELKGYFTKEGLTYTNSFSDVSPSVWVSVVLAGNANFLGGANGSVITSIQQGAPLRAVGMDSIPGDYEVGISSSFAAAHNIPAKGNTEAQAIAQFKALKGTHISIAVSTFIGAGTNWLIVLANKYGLTAGLNSPNDDINIDSAGSSTLADTAFETGKVDAIDVVPPFPPSPPVGATIQMNLIKPISSAAGDYILTTTSMIAQHPDTVQAVVTALTEGIEYIKTHPNQALAMMEPSYAGFGLPPSEYQLLFDNYANISWLMYPSLTAYNAEVLTINEGDAVLGKQISAPYSAFVSPRFATIALRQLGLQAKHVGLGSS